MLKKTPNQTHKLCVGAVHCPWASTMERDPESEDKLLPKFSLYLKESVSCLF